MVSSDVKAVTPSHYPPNNGHRFLFAWHTESAVKPEYLSMSARNGQFRPYEEVDLAAYLNLDTMKSLQYFDVANSVWVTVFRTSPPLPVKPNATLHFKDSKTEVDMQKLLGPQLEVIFSPEQPRKPELLGGDPVGSSPSPSSPSSHPTTPPATPTNVRTHEWDDEEVGTRPCRITKFPGLTVREVGERFEWLHQNRRRGTLSARFGAVYRTPYHSSTYHRHYSAWKWLVSNGKLAGEKESTLWKDMMRLTPAANTGISASSSSTDFQTTPIDLTNDAADDNGNLVKTESSFGEAAAVHKGVVEIPD